MKRAVVLLTAVLGAGTAYAQDGMIPPGTEELKINLGGILTTNNTALRIDGANRGTEIDLENLAGVKDDVSTFFASGTWRFAPNHRLSLSGFAIDRDHSKVIDRTVTIGDTVIPINTNLTAEAKSTFFIVDYQYSFVRNEAMELAGTLGLYSANFKYKFTAANPVINVDRDTTAPLPLIGLSADFFLTPRWTVSAFGQGMKFKVADVDGSAYYAGVSTDYMLTRHWGLGIGYQVADVDVDVTKSSYKGHVAWRMDGYFAYVEARF